LVAYYHPVDKELEGVWFKIKQGEIIWSVPIDMVDLRIIIYQLGD
jgi:hypothetical protein